MYLLYFVAQTSFSQLIDDDDDDDDDYDDPRFHDLIVFICGKGSNQRSG